MKGWSIPAAWYSHLPRIGLGLAVVMLFILHSFRVINLPFIESFEGVLYDARLRATMPGTVYTQVVIIDIDEKSLKAEGRWPWGRERMGELVKQLSDHYKVAVLGMDVVFAEPENLATLNMMARLSQQGAVQSKETKAMFSKLQSMLDGDRAFARSLKDQSVVLGYYFKYENNIEAENTSGKLPAPACDLAQAASKGMKLPQAAGYGANLPELQEAAAGGGHFIPNVDADGSIRSLPLLMAYQGGCYEALSLAVFRKALEASTVTIEKGNDRWSRQNLNVGGLQIPVNEQGSAWIPYRGYQHSFPYISAVDILQGRADPRQLEGVIALLGTTAAGLLDARATPVGNPYAGVEVHANMVAGMLDGRIKKSPTVIPAIESWLLLLVGVLMAVLLGKASPVPVFWYALGAGVLVTILNMVLWLSAAVVLPLASLLLLIVTLFILNMSYGFLAAERAKRLLKERWGQYVSPEVIEELMSNPALLESMEGSSRNMTVLFSDIRNFTTISEGMEPKQLMRMMNEYLTPMTRLIIDKSKYQGTIDKYIGDAIMAFWGAPLFDDHHARNAVLAALEMQQLADELSMKFKAQGWSAIRIGIGLNTGMMAVGNMGSSFRRAYTVLGDPVNLAARLEGLTKEYGVGILVSESTMQNARGIVYRELDRVRVKGKGQAVSIYEPICISEEVSAAQLEHIKQFEQMLSCYRAQQWKEAGEILDNLPQSDEVLVRLYRERITELQANASGANWDGVTTFKTK